MESKVGGCDSVTVGESVNGLDEQNREIKHSLFDRYITPNLNLVYYLCCKYTSDPQFVDDNYVDVLDNFYRYIMSYDTGRPIATWIHITTKRFVYNADNRRSAFKRNDDNDIEDFADMDYCKHSGLLSIDDEIPINSYDPADYRKYYTDDVLWALDRLKPIYRDAIILQQAGYKLVEIMDMTYENGTLKTKNLETVKSRLFLGKQRLVELLNRDGTKRNSDDED